MRWNSAKCFADYLDLNAQELCMGKNVLELGAGAGLPSLVTALNGARKVTEIKKFWMCAHFIDSQVVTTDYPDAELIQNLTINVEKNISQEKSNSIAVEVPSLICISCALHNWTRVIWRDSSGALQFHHFFRPLKVNVLTWFSWAIYYSTTRRLVVDLLVIPRDPYSAFSTMPCWNLVSNSSHQLWPTNKALDSPLVVLSSLHIIDPALPIEILLFLRKLRQQVGNAKRYSKKRCR